MARRRCRTAASWSGPILDGLGEKRGRPLTPRQPNATARPPVNTSANPRRTARTPASALPRWCWCAAASELAGLALAPPGSRGRLRSSDRARWRGHRGQPGRDLETCSRFRLTTKAQQEQPGRDPLDERPLPDVAAPMLSALAERLDMPMKPVGERPWRSSQDAFDRGIGDRRLSQEIATAPGG